MQLMGIPPSAVSTCSLYPIQEVVWPLALRLVPTSQALGRSASICGRLIVSCRSSRLGSFACSSPLRGRPRLRRRFGFAAFGFGAGFSRASIAVASREMCSTRWPSIVRAISVSCRRLARPLSANSEKARENVASLGSRPAPLQPHSRHSLPSTSRRSIRPRVVGTRLHSSVVIMRCFATAHDTHEGGPVPPQGPSLRQKSRSPQLFCKRL